MDPLIAFLLVVIVLSSGLIGMLADSLGRKLGKKKLSFRSMRPKHVARLGTFIAGMLVSVVTLLMVFFTSSDVREWIIRGRKAIQLANQLEAQNQGLKDEIASRTAKIDSLDGQVHSLDQRVIDKENKLVDAQKHLISIRQELVQAQTRYTQAQVALAKGQRLLAESNTKLAENQAQLSARKKDLARVSHNLAEAKQQYTVLSKSYAEVDKERKEADEKVVDLNRQADQLRTEMTSLTNDKAGLEKDKQTALTELADYQTKLRESSADLVAKKDELNNANKELDSVTQGIQELNGLLHGDRNKAVIFLKDQEITRIKAGAHLSRAQAIDTLNRLIRNASRIAETRGAKALPNGEYAVGFWSKLLPSGQAYTPEAQQEAVLDQLTNYPSDVVLIARTYVNSFTGEFVPIDVNGYNDPVVYKKGEIMAELHVEKNTSREKVLVLLNDFMRQTVHDSAIHRGMIPVSGTNGDLSVELEPARTLDLLDELANSVRNVRLQIIARNETRAADALQLDFLIK